MASRSAQALASLRAVACNMAFLSLRWCSSPNRAVGWGWADNCCRTRRGGLHQLPLRLGPACCSSSCKQVQTWGGHARASNWSLSRQLRGDWLMPQLCLRAWSMRRWRRMRLLTRGARYEPRRASSLARITRAWRSTSTMGGCQESGRKGVGESGAVRWASQAWAGRPGGGWSRGCGGVGTASAALR